jgi:hypothetical protein
LNSAVSFLFQFPPEVLCVRILSFLSGPPNYGVRNTSLQSAASDYEKIAQGLFTRRAVVDVFAIGTANIDLEAFERLSSTGNGSIMIYPDLDNASLPQDLFARVQRSHGFDCMLRLSCSRGFKVSSLLFNFVACTTTFNHRNSAWFEPPETVHIVQVARAYGNLFSDREFENL